MRNEISLDSLCATLAYAMDHGCHYTPLGKGSHGKDIDADMNICHHYRIYPKG